MHLSVSQHQDPAPLTTRLKTASSAYILWLAETTSLFKAAKGVIIVKKCQLFITMTALGARAQKKRRGRMPLTAL